MLEVRLVGRPGNHTAAGPMITVRLKETKKAQSTEVTIGSGYLGQSEPARWFGLGAVAPTAPVEVEVRWPDGKTSRQNTTAGARRLVIRR